MATDHQRDEPDEASRAPQRIGKDVQLFLDDFLVDHLEGLSRHVEQPERLPSPMLDNATFGTTQPYLTVLRDSEDEHRLRLWYNRGSAVWHATSTDGVTWGDARLVWDVRSAFGCSLVDDGPATADPARRFKLANWQRSKKRREGHIGSEGMCVAFSPDGLQWNAAAENPVLHTWPEGYPRFVAEGVGDIIDVWFDPARRRYAAAVKVEAVAEDGYARAPRAGMGFRRLVGMTTSEDFVHWKRPQRILVPDERDDGLFEFYGMGAMHQRGGLSIGLVRVLRDDLPCEEGGPPDGIGYTVLATSRDGATWTRYREPFLDRNPQPGSWDHAMTWASAVVPRGDELYVYYGGYARGHKVAHETERQIGLARMRRDRYVALRPRQGAGRLTTRRFILPSARLAANLRAVDGTVRVRLLDGRENDGNPAAALADSRPLQGDLLDGQVQWTEPIGRFIGRPVRLEFEVRQAALFGFAFH